MKYSVYAIATASQYIGDFEADTKLGAEELASAEAHMSICHQCGSEIEIGDIYEFQCEEMPDDC